MDGFRLPTSMEWELAARYKGSNSSYGAMEFPAGSGNYWTPGNYASGATDDYTNEEATRLVAWYNVNSDDKTQDVGRKEANYLGVYDMSGNEWEWCFTQRGPDRVGRGGRWDCEAQSLQVGSSDARAPSGQYGSMGLRLVRTHF